MILFKKQSPLISLFAILGHIDVLSLNNPKFNDYLDVIYPEELEIKDTTDAPKWVNIFLTFVWSLMRMVNFAHDSMTSVMTLISL